MRRIRLALRRETLRTLSSSALHGVAGGITARDVTCASVICATVGEPVCSGQSTARPSCDPIMRPCWPPP